MGLLASKATVRGQYQVAATNWRRLDKSSSGCGGVVLSHAPKQPG
jgi:hypothetical protein